MTGTVVNYGQLRFIKSLMPECRELSDCRRILQKQYEILAGLSGSYDDPEVVIIDFNLSDSGVFQYNKEVRGTRDYAAPEQFDVGY